MRKALNVAAWLGLVVCLMWAANLSGQKNAVSREWKDALREKDVLQKLYDEAKEQAEKAREENQALLSQREEMALELEAAQSDAAEREEAVNALRQQWEDAEREAGLQAEQRMTEAQAQWDAQRAALTEERDAARQRLAEVLSLLMPAEEAAAAEGDAEPDAGEEPAPDSLNGAFATVE